MDGGGGGGGLGGERALEEGQVFFLGIKFTILISIYATPTFLSVKIINAHVLHVT